MAPGIKIQTCEGYTVQVDVTVLYRIDDPLKVMQTSGPGRLFEDSAVIPRAQQHLRRTLGELDAEDFYQGDSRSRRRDAGADRRWRWSCATRASRSTQVLIRRYTYDQRYQQAIESGRFRTRPSTRTRRKRRPRPQQRRRTNTIAEGAAAVADRADARRGRGEEAGGRRPTSTNGRRRRTEMLVELAEAKGTELENKALRGRGSENMVGLRMARGAEGHPGDRPAHGRGGRHEPARSEDDAQALRREGMTMRTFPFDRATAVLSAGCTSHSTDATEVGVLTRNGSRSLRQGRACRTRSTRPARHLLLRAVHHRLESTLRHQAAEPRDGDAEGRRPTRRPGVQDRRRQRHLGGRHRRLAHRPREGARTCSERRRLHRGQSKDRWCGPACAASCATCSTSSTSEEFYDSDKRFKKAEKAGSCWPRRSRPRA